MQLVHDGRTVRYADGGLGHDRDDPGVVLIHGSGMNRTVWQLQTRFLAHHGYRVAALDLAGHGGSEGPPSATIEEMADWVCGVIGSLGFGTAHLVGHSMGSLVALEAAARHPATVSSIVLVGTASTMPVHPELLSASHDDIPRAARLMTSWAYSTRAHVGHHASPGFWLLGGSTALIDRSPPGALGAAMTACANYVGGLAAAASVTCPVTLILGGADKMTPVKAGTDLAAAFPTEPRVEIFDGVGHMIQIEAPDAARAAIAAALGRRSDG